VPGNYPGRASAPRPVIVGSEIWVVLAVASADERLGAVPMAPDGSRNQGGRSVRQTFMRALATAVVIVLAAACSSSASVPQGFLQLHFNTWPKPWTTATVSVGSSLAVRAITGHNAGTPESENPSVVRVVNWSGKPSPAHWYAFKVLAPGKVDIRQTLPCQGTGCAAAEALIEITVTPRRP
jgi:hypothetical protein